MARAATTADAFNAVAEPRRREILDLLAGGELAVNDLVAASGLAQPQVSKHLRVLREVGLVEVREAGRQRLYRLDGRPLESIHRWVAQYREAWEERFQVLDDVLAELKNEEQGDDGHGNERDGGSESSVGHGDHDHPGVRGAAAPRLPSLDES
ncbi:MAG: ArsR/SmtB family transcription factor [Gemmatimonadales bacterium]